MLLYVCCYQHAVLCLMLLFVWQFCVRPLRINAIRSVSGFQMMQAWPCCVCLLPWLYCSLRNVFLLANERPAWYFGCRGGWPVCYAPVFFHRSASKVLFSVSYPPPSACAKVFACWVTVHGVFLFPMFIPFLLLPDGCK
jgi:hypothetical protein